MEKNKAVEISSSQLELEEEEKEEVKEGEKEAEEEVVEEEEEENEPEHEEGEDEAEEDEEEFMEMCDVCLKDKDHWTDECPYLVYIPNLMEVTLGKGYDIVCLRCNVFGGHSDVAGMDCKVCGGNPNGRWIGRAKFKYCVICKHYDHRYLDCPKKYLLETQKSVSDCVDEYDSWLATKKSQTDKGW
ncbi:hypothetical protein ACLB2K_054937 [Fragaria x ananassa]